MSNSFILATYLAASKALVPYANRLLKRRLEAGKEDASRIAERRGVASVARPPGVLIWFHAASVGESLSLLNLIDALIDEMPDLNVLITTGTKTSAEVLATRLPYQCIHQYIPLDTQPFVTAFLDHWSPDVAVWTESEFWPALICATHARDIPMVSLNTRISRDSFRKWRWLRGVARALFARFALFLVQDKTTENYLQRLGAEPGKIRITGSLKESGGALPHDETERLRIAQALDTRPVWLAASTHPGEEDIAADAHHKARTVAPRLLLIIAPRHPERGPEIAANLCEKGWQVGLRSRGDQPDTNVEIYIADTLGEMGLWYRLAPTSFIGGSLVKIGGHNPYEPAALGSAILYGPHIENARATYEQLYDAEAARLVSNADDLAEAVILLQEPHRSAAMAHAAWEVSSKGAQAAEIALETLGRLIAAAEDNDKAQVH